MHQGVPRMKRHVKASHASATPATDGRSIVALLGSEGLFCFDMNGNLKWRQDLGVMDVGLVDDPSYQWGPASSPIDLRQPRHRPERPAQGFVRRRVRSRHRQGTVADVARRVSVLGDAGNRARTARTEIVTNAGKFIRGLDPKTGRELWRLSDNQTQVKVPTPIVAGDLVIVTGGYPPGGRPIYAIRPGGSGELSRSRSPGRRIAAHRTPERRFSTTASSTPAPTTAS